MIDFFKFIVNVTVSLFYFTLKRNKNLFFSCEGDLSLKLNGKSISPIFCGLKWKLKSRDIHVYELRKYYSRQKMFTPNLDNFQWLFIKLARSREKGIEWAFRYLKPINLFFIDYDYALNKTANKLNIDVYYVQHGVINRNHHIWTQSITDDLKFSFLLWDKQSEELFESNKNIKTYVIGNLWFSYLLSNENDKFINNLNSKYNLKFDNNKPKVLVTLTYNNPDFNFLTEELEKLITMTVGDYQWLIRLHPVTYNNQSELEKFKNYLNEKFNFDTLNKICWFEASSYPLPLILRNIDFHITIESSVILDAELMNIPSLLLNTKVLQFSPEGKSFPPYGGTDYFKSQLNNGILKVLSIDYGSITDWLYTVKKGEIKVESKNSDESTLSLFNQLLK